MEKSFSDMINLFAYSSNGEMPFLKIESDVSQIRIHALHQGVWPLVFLSLNHLQRSGDIDLPSEVFQAYQREVLQAALRNTQRWQFVRQSIGELEKNGIKCCVIKGEVLAGLYRNPECRISGDTDILIKKKLEGKALKIMQKLGYQVTPSSNEMHHAVCRHPIGGLVELHFSLYDEFIEDAWFDNKALVEEPFIEGVTADGQKVTTLSLQDGLVFTALHFIKHFLCNGAGIRQLMDTLLYMSRYKNEIDWDKFNSLMEYLKFDKFMQNVIGIGVTYLGFSRDSLPKADFNEDLMEGILSDFQSSGLFGKKQTEHVQFYKYFNQKRFSVFKDDSRVDYMNKKIKSSFLSLLFLNKYAMMTKYPILKKHGFLLPFFWFKRILTFIWGFIRGRKSISSFYTPYVEDDQQNDAVKEKMSLVSELEMI